MKDKDYSLDALGEFFDFAAAKGLIKQNTAQSRKLASNKVLSVLDDSEKANLRDVDIDKAFERFQNLQGKSYKPDSLQVYLSRVKTALSDFISYVDNPASFKPGGAQRATSQTIQHVRRTRRTRTSADRIKESHVEHELPQDHHDYHVVVPVPLREGLVVKISNLPSDLTVAEAGRLAAIIKAYAVIGEE